MASEDKIQIAEQSTSELISKKIDGITGYIGENIPDISETETNIDRIEIANQETSDEIVNKLDNLQKVEDKRNTTVWGMYNSSEASDIGVIPHSSGKDYIGIITRPRESGYMTPDTLIQTWVPGLTADKVQSGVTFGSSLTLNGTYTSDATAAESQILSGYTSYSKGTKITGTMSNQGAKTSTLTTNGSSYTIPAGYHNGSGKVTANITNLTAGNIKTGISVGGVTGTFKGLGNATAAQVLAGKTFSTASLSNATGTMVDNSGKTSTSSYVAGTFRSGTTGYVFASPTAGYCSANTYIRVPVTNLSAANIKKGVSIGGITGTYDSSNTTYTLTINYNNASQSNFNTLVITDKTGTIKSLSGDFATNFPLTVTITGDTVSIRYYVRDTFGSYPNNRLYITSGAILLSDDSYGMGSGGYAGIEHVYFYKLTGNAILYTGYTTSN